MARLLRDVHHLAERRYKGDYDACVILVDLDRALAQAGLTPRQAEALHLVYWRDMRQVDAAEAMGVTQERVVMVVVSALRKIAAVYAEWERKGEANGTR